MLIIEKDNEKKGLLFEWIDRFFPKAREGYILLELDDSNM